MTGRLKRPRDSGRPMWPQAAALVIFLLLTSCQTAVASEQMPVAEDYLLGTWQTDAGLPQNSVSAILQAREGYLWLGTFNGLVRFDGIRFTTFTVGNSPGLRSDSVVTLFQDRSGRLWVGTDGGGLACFHEGKFKGFAMPNRLGASVVSAIAEDQHGTLWIGTDGGLYRLSEDLLEEVKTADSPGGFGVVQKICCDAEGTVWISAADSLWIKRQGQLRHATEYGRVSALTCDNNSAVWFASKTKGLVRSGVPVSLSQWDLNDRMPSFICPTRNGDIWSVERSTLTRWRTGTRTDYSLAGGLFGSDVLAVLEDREQNIWIGANGGGLTRLREKVVVNYSTENGLPGNDVVVLAEDHLGRKWIGGFGTGVGVWEREHYQRLAGLPAGREDVISLWRGHSNRMWVGTRDGKLFRWESDAAIISEPEVADGARIVFEDGDGGLWLGTRRQGVELRRGGRVTRYSLAQGLSDTFVTGIAQTPDGAIWIGTKHGLNRVVNGQISRFYQKDGLGADCIHTLYIDTGGILWVGTAGGGVAALKNGRFGAVTAQQGLPNDVVGQIIEDGLGSIWIGSNAGIFRVNREELLKCSEGKRGLLHCQTFGRDAGLLNPECAGSFQPSCIKAPDGRLWFATVGGIVVIDPSRLVPNLLPPPVHVSCVMADGKICRLMAGTTNSGAQVRVPPQPSRVQIDYTGLDYVSPETVRFRVRLEPVDREWVEAGTHRSAYYNRLPPGQYRFEVIACNNDGVWNQTGASVNLFIEPLWSQTLWFKAVVLLLLLLTSFGTVWSLHNRRLRRALELAQQRTAHARAEELGTLNQLLQSRTLELENALANVKTLKGLIPICAHCKKVRTDGGFWQQVEAYVQHYSEATFSHGLCPQCTPIYFPIED